MKKIQRFLFCFVLVFIISSPLLINAQVEPAGGKYGLTETAKKADLTADGKTETPQVIISKIVGYVLAFVGIIILVNIIFAGYSWMNSGGNEEKVGEAKEKIKNSVIGLIIILAAYIITNSLYGFLSKIL